MKKKIAIALTLIATAFTSLPSSAFDLTGLLKGNSGTTVGNLLEGVFMKSDLTVDDLAGIWTADQPAVSFKSDDMLKKAGGIAAAAALESKLKPYFEQYGLTGAVLTVNPDKSFTLKSSKLNLSGTISQGSDGMFIFSIKAFGALKLGDIPAYVQKTSKSMDVMFDSSKLKSLVNTISKFLNMKSISAITSLIDSYDGIYIGFGMDKTGETVESDKNNNGVGSLLNILKGGSQKKDSTTTATPSPSTETQQQSSGDKIKEGIGNALKGILNGKGSNNSK